MRSKCRLAICRYGIQAAERAVDAGVAFRALCHAAQTAFELVRKIIYEDSKVKGLLVGRSWRRNEWRLQTEIAIWKKAVEPPDDHWV